LIAKQLTPIRKQAGNIRQVSTASGGPSREGIDV